MDEKSQLQNATYFFPSLIVGWYMDEPSTLTTDMLVESKKRKPLRVPLLTTSNTKLVHLYRAEIYTQYLELRCLATKKKVCGLATTSPSLEFEGE